MTIVYIIGIVALGVCMVVVKMLDNKENEKPSGCKGRLFMICFYIVVLSFIIINIYNCSHNSSN